MDMRRNEFVERPSDAQDPFLIPFDLGEELVFKGYRFRVEHIDLANKPTLLVLSPVGPTSERQGAAELEAMVTEATK